MLRSSFYFALFISVLLAGTAAGQTITTDPAFPTEDRPIEITFDVSGTPLGGFSGDVYAHTGVIVSEEDKDSGAWSYVIAGWDTNIDKAQLTSLGDNKWQLSIDDIREYYEVPDSEERIYQLAFVLRTSTGAPQTDDLFVDIFDNPVNVRTTSPDGSSDIITVGESYEIVAIGNTEAGESIALSLTLDGTEVASSEDESLTYEFTPSEQANFDFTLSGEDDLGNVNDYQFRLVAVPDVIDQQRPAGIEDGITYTSDTSVTLSFFAPYKENAFVIGDFNGWQPDADYFMKRDFANEDSVHYWIELDGFTPGEEVRFQYLVDGDLRLADVFSELVLDPNHDRFISSDIYPNMPEYPTGLTTDIVSVMQPGRAEYEWQVTDFERPNPEDLIIYELLMRDFIEESSFDVLRDTLDYLENLGINAIELMPVSQFDGNLSWGYNPVFHGALDKAYGNRESFKKFVDEAHSRGMAVILDVVYNHAHERSSLIRLYGEGQANNRFVGPGHAFNVFQHLNHDDPYIKYWLDRMNRYWLETYNVDGYRFDLTKGFATNVQDGNLLQGPNQPRIENLKRMYDVVREYDESAYMILEHFADNSEEQQLEAHGMMLWGNHHFNYTEGAMGYNDSGKSNMSGIYFQNRGFQNPHLIGYKNSHDEQWLMRKMREYGNDTNPDHNIKELDVALDRMKLAGAFFFTIPGPKMIWQFEELGYGWNEGECIKAGDGDGDCEPSEPDRTGEKPIRWDYFEDDNRRELYNTWADLINLRKASPAFSSADTQFESFLNGATKWIKLQHPDMDAVIIGNFDVFERDRQISFTQTGTWYEYFSNTVHEFDDTNQTFTLAPGEFQIFTTNQIDVVYTSSEREGPVSETPGSFNLEQNFPNPFNPTTQIRYDVPEASAVKLEVYDMLGRRVAVLVNNENHPSGSHTVTFDAANLSSGVYMARMTSGSKSMIRKMTLIK